MESFKHVFMRLCKENHIEPQDCVLAQLKSFDSGKGKHVLDLSTNSLSAKTCHALGKAIATDKNFREIKFADCMLSEDGVKGLAYGFSTNNFCKKLDMKGNNIRGTGVDFLGKMLRHNHTLLSLCLEWNALGMLDDSFALFCEGVGSNDCLQALDIRNNQINHDGAAELAAGLKRNSTLRSLDLRWNSIGLLGGRALLEMLQTNKTLCRMELAGNNIPVDILKSIETAISQNEDRALVTGEYSKKITLMSKHMKQMEHDKSLQMGDLMDTIDKQEELLRRSKRSATDKITNLQGALEERKSSFNSVASKLAMTESELALTEQKCNDYSMLITKLKQELSNKVGGHQEDLRRYQEDRAVTEAKLYKEVSVAHDKNIQLETKLEDAERKCRLQQDQIFELREQTTHLSAEIKLKGTHFDERLQQERIRHKDDLRDAEQIRQKEVARVRQEAEETESALRERIQKLEMTRLSLEEEISKHKNANMNNKLHHEEQLSLAKQKLMSEEELRQQHVEEKLKLEMHLKDELQSRCNQMSGQASELQSKNSSLTMELELMKRRVEELHQELSDKNSMTLSEVGKVKIDLNQTITKLDGERKIQAELREQLGEADRKMSEQLLRHRQLLEEKDLETEDLKRRLKSREAELNGIREEESQRAQVLQNAIMNYVNKVPPH
ncbi:leucine-rich repeat-containing protein 45-like [Pecten maximus]|uniref:leucine-rich repeat-containing protein 45-like n=1 Tax=Pecten maximus TaxID=6579 RepID=UPI001457F707|nr:leucine-rich repeat-containing protein 45-like [Pecten maximus]